jgi:APA family basic amino acid/polyamine antiporter
MDSADTTRKSMGLLGATGVGVGAIVGGGILALAGVAFAAAGPATIIAFALNGAIALLTALSFAEMASRFPESGGTYTFSRKVLSVEAAFTVGWVVWFASVVAAVLYALGFAHFALVMISELCTAAGREAPTWLVDRRLVPLVACGTTLLLTCTLIWSSAGGGPWPNVIKVAVFAALILGGLWAIYRQPSADTQAALQPFFSGGMAGLFQAMGYSFIALQGFDLIAAVGGEVRNAEKTIPRAMLLSLAIALAIYIPLLLVITTVGVPVGQDIQSVAQNDPEGIVAIAARNYLGPTGYWLVIVAAVLSMFTALQANLFAASRIALSMAKDHTLPSVMSRISANHGTPAVAISVTAALVCLILAVLPDVAAAGAASSLIFLMTFAIAHWLSILVRLRSTRRPPPFRTPLFPAVPILGGLSCIALAVFQGVAVPSAGTIAVIWLSVGGILFLSLFSRRARLRDVTSVAADPELLTLRGHAPLVLVPIANPRNAEVMLALAGVLVPAEVGRVLIQSIVVAPADWRPEKNSEPIDRSQEVLRELLSASVRVGVRVEALTTISPNPMEEIARVAELHRCESVLLGLSQLGGAQDRTPLEKLLSRLNSDVVVLRAPENWQLSDAQNILVPVAGRGGHDRLLARLLGSLSREQKRDVTFFRSVPTSTSAKELGRVQRDLARLARDNLRGKCGRTVIHSDDPISATVEAAENCGLLILGIQRLGPREKLFGHFTREVAKRTTCPIIAISRRG